MIERRFKREITVKKNNLNYTTYVKYYSKHFKSVEYVQTYLNYLQNKACKRSTDSRTVNYYVEIEAIEKYVKI